MRFDGIAMAAEAMESPALRFYRPLYQRLSVADLPLCRDAQAGH